MKEGMIVGSQINESIFYALFLGKEVVSCALQKGSYGNMSA